MKYRIIRPWFGRKRGEVIELDKLHPAIKNAVERVQDEAVPVDAAEQDAAQDETAPTGKAGKTAAWQSKQK